MAQKNTKIDDVKRSDKVTPSATSRPILVSSQSSSPTDPMMVPAGSEENTGEVSQVMSHTAKTIKPPTEAGVDSISKKENPAKPRPTEESAIHTDSGVAEAKSEDTEASVGITSEAVKEPKPAAGNISERADKAKAAQDAERDPDAALSAEETAAAEAKAKRDQELEALISSGKYALPINAVQRRRSRLNSLLLSLLAVLLALALLDAVADVGIVRLPDSIPHTHFFSGR